jgi:hypothetical protein
VSGKVNTGKPNIQVMTVLPTAQVNTIYCNFRPDKCWIVAHGAATDAKRFCKINISSKADLQIAGTAVSTYTIYNSSGTTGTYTPDNRNCFTDNRIQFYIPTTTLCDGTVYYEVYIVG